MAKGSFYHIRVGVSTDIVRGTTLVVSLVPFFFKCLPNHGKGEALETVGEDPGAKSAAKQTLQTIGVKDHADCLRISNWILIGLFGGLYDTQTIAATIRDD